MYIKHGIKKTLFQVKPTTVQVNLSSCCVVPQELTTFAQKHDIQVLTHNDPAGEYRMNSVNEQRLW